MFSGGGRATSSSFSPSFLRRLLRRLAADEERAAGAAAGETASAAGSLRARERLRMARTGALWGGGAGGRRGANHFDRGDHFNLAEDTFTKPHEFTPRTALVLSKVSRLS